MKKPEFFLYTRIDCHLCTNMRLALHAAAAGREYACHFIDVDEDPDLKRRYGDRVPVLVLNGQVVCESKFDHARVEARLCISNT